MDNLAYMSHALNLASRGIGRTSPNPVVGAVIVRDGQIVGEGWHMRAGTPHAEIHAINQAGKLAIGATLYVTLEPCSHYGRTGPCTDAIINAGITKVIVAMTDPNPLVAGRGIAKLRAAGIEVIDGLHSAEAAALNEVFIKWITTKIPFVILKTAMTMDGKTATRTGHSQWITGIEARTRVHQFRDQYDAILVGIGTALADDPELTTRLVPNGKNPIRVIVDSLARIPLTAKVINDGQAPTIIAVTPVAPKEKIQALQAKGVEVITVAGGGHTVDLRILFELLGARGISSIFVEGGPTISAALLEENLIDKIHCFVAPKIIGGVAAPGVVGGYGIDNLHEAILLESISSEFIGQDILISGYVMQREGRDVYRTCGRIREGKED